MKKKLTLLFASAIILFSACTKDSELPVISDSSWIFNGTAHFVTASSRGEASGSEPAHLNFADKNKNRNASLTVYFKTLPLTASSYTIVKGGTLAANQCIVTTKEGDGSEFLLSGTASAPLVVSFKAGKIKIDFPEINMSTASGSENYKLKASVYEHD